MTSEDSVCGCSTRLAMNERSLDREHIASTIPIIDRKFLGVALNNSLNVRHIFWIFEEYSRSCACSP